MNLLKFIKGKYFLWRANKSCQRLLSQPLINSIDPEIFSDSAADPTAYYLRAYQDFHKTIPQVIRDHRNYFRQNQRGFGEDAFHTMWWRLVNQFKPSNFLEIGVYRGQVLSLVSLLGKLNELEIQTTGISPFSPAGDSVSVYIKNLDYVEDTKRNIKYFDLPDAELIRAFSTDAKALERISSTQWDMIYIDGNHEYDVVLSDWESCSKALKVGGIIVIDDSGLSSAYTPPPFATGGHPGPSKLAAEIDPEFFKEILQVGHNRVFQKIA